MLKKDKRIDAYITKSAGFAQSILIHLRKIIHEACPDVQETIKWGFPHFEYNNEVLCSMASFKQHCAFIFWKAPLLSDPNKILQKTEKTGMGHLGQIKSMEDLPSDKILKAYLKEAVELSKQGVKLTKAKPTEKKELTIPDYFTKALQKNKKALNTFESFSYSNKKEYVQWITEAKTEDTRNKRMATALEWMGEGKIRNWKYVKK